MEEKRFMYKTEDETMYDVFSILFKAVILMAVILGLAILTYISLYLLGVIP